MSIQLVPTTEEIIEAVRRRTGKPVVVREADEDLGGFARVKIARPWENEHVILLARQHLDIASYMVAHECGHILRIHAVPPEERLVPVSTAEHRRVVQRDMEVDFRRLAEAMPVRLLAEMVDRWHQGIVYQVTNQPADIMIERWIFREHEELRPLQKTALETMHRDAVRTLDDDIKRITPGKVYKASVAMNYAFFAALSEFLGQEFLRAFCGSPHAKEGEELRALSVDGDPDSVAWDIQMADAWAEKLGIRCWYAWTDVESLPQGSMREELDR